MLLMWWVCKPGCNSGIASRIDSQLHDRSARAQFGVHANHTNIPSSWSRCLDTYWGDNLFGIFGKVSLIAFWVFILRFLMNQHFSGSDRLSMFPLIVTLIMSDQRLYLGFMWCLYYIFDDARLPRFDSAQKGYYPWRSFLVRCWLDWSNKFRERWVD